MSDKPLETAAEREHRIRERAYQLWEDAGRPPGRAEEYWARAEHQIGVEDSPAAGQSPTPATAALSEAAVPPGGPKIRKNQAGSPERLTDAATQQQTPKTKAPARKSKAKPAGGDVP
jgi:hypothetical protein